MIMSWLRLLLVSVCFTASHLARWSDEPIKLVGHREKAVSALAFSTDGKLLVSAGYDERIRIWDIAAKKEKFQFDTGLVYALAFSKDGKTCAAASKVGEIQIYDALKGQEIRRWKAHTGPAAALAFA